MLILGIETSCDETSAAVVRNGREVLSNVIHSQVATHAIYGGVVPELASREHLVKIRPVAEQALVDAQTSLDRIDGIAVTYGPGLIGSLLVGLTYAKALAYSLKTPLMAVNHIEGHIYSVFLDHAEVEFPSLALVVSGGHTSLFWVESATGDFRSLRYELLARTRDDAAGEAYDKVAKLLGLSYPGGPVIDKLARLGDPAGARFPIARFGDQSMDFSFSGVKTAVLRLVKSEGLVPKNAEATLHDARRLDILAGFQESIAEALTAATLRAARAFRPRSIMLSGGVAANSRLRELMSLRCEAEGLRLYYPRPILTTDNAAMIAATGWAKLLRGETADMSVSPDPNLQLAAYKEGLRQWKI